MDNSKSADKLFGALSQLLFLCITFANTFGFYKDDTNSKNVRIKLNEQRSCVAFSALNLI